MRNFTRRVIFTLAGLAFAAPSSAFAREYYYFYKMGQPRDAYIADRLECDRLIGGVDRRASSVPSHIYVQNNSSLTAGQNALAAGLAGLFAGMMAGAEIRRVGNAVERTCMADKGYARYAVDKAVVQDIEKLEKAEDRVERYFALATADTPVGQKIKE